MVISMLLLFLCCLRSTNVTNQSITNTTHDGINNTINNINHGQIVFLTHGIYSRVNNTEIMINNNYFQCFLNYFN